MQRNVSEGVRFSTFPQTAPPPAFTDSVITLFQHHAHEISTVALDKGLTSDEVLAALRPDLQALGFGVEGGKHKAEKIQRPVFFGENGTPTLRYEIDAYQPDWRCGMEVEAGRAWMGNAVYRDLIQASVMVNVDYLVLAVPIAYKYRSGGRRTISNDYVNTRDLARALYGHTRLTMPYSLVLVGY